MIAMLPWLRCSSGVSATEPCFSAIDVDMKSHSGRMLWPCLLRDIGASHAVRNGWEKISFPESSLELRHAAKG